MSMLAEVAAYLQAQNLAGSASGWPLYRGALPDDDNADESHRKVSHRAVGLFHRGGGRAEVRAGVRYPELFVQVRGEPGKGDATLERAELIFNGLNGKGEAPNFQTIQSLDSLADIQSFADDLGRPNFTMSFEVMLQ